MFERTLSIIKPDAVKKGVIGDILGIFEKNALKIVAMKMMNLTKENAMDFYLEHSSRPFYNFLCDFMSSGPIVVQVLEGENAILKNRELMGDTNPEDADKGTIRALHGASIDNNAVHGSDSKTSAHREIKFFFPNSEIFGSKSKA